MLYKSNKDNDCAFVTVFNATKTRHHHNSKRYWLHPFFLFLPRREVGMARASMPTVVQPPHIHMFSWGTKTSFKQPMLSFFFLYSSLQYKLCTNKNRTNCPSTQGKGTSRWGHRESSEDTANKIHKSQIWKELRSLGWTKGDNPQELTGNHVRINRHLLNTIVKLKQCSAPNHFVSVTPNHWLPHAVITLPIHFFVNVANQQPWHSITTPAYRVSVKALAKLMHPSLPFSFPQAI